MILFPAIDIKDGSCVRLVKGKMNQATIFNKDPLNQAKIFESKGCDWIHVVDLDGAVKGESINKEIIKKIISSVDVKIQLGGGIREVKDINFWLDNNIDYLIIGSFAIKNCSPDLSAQWP